MDTRSLDYLDKIAPKQVKRKAFELNLKNILLLSGAVIVLIIIAVIIARAFGSQRVAPWQQLSVRLANTEAIANTASASIKNSQLRSLNSELRIQIVNTQRDLATPFTSVGVNPKKIPASVATTEDKTNTDMKTRLETGRLNAKYDSTYAREMSYQLSTILALYQQLYAQSGPTTKELLTTAYNNLAPTQKSIAEFSASNE